MTYKYFSYYQIHHVLTQEKFGSEEVRLPPLTPLLTILSKTNLVLFGPTTNNCFVTPYTIVYGSEDPNSLFYSLLLPGGRVTDLGEK